LSINGQSILLADNTQSQTNVCNSLSQEHSMP
jgi:hypothetical protein